MDAVPAPGVGLRPLVAIGAMLVLSLLVEPAVTAWSPRLGAASCAAWPGRGRMGSPVMEQTSTRDPWGSPIRASYRGPNREQLFSSGPDGRRGTPDDIAFTDDDLESGTLVGMIPIALRAAAALALWCLRCREVGRPRSRSLQLELRRAARLASVPAVILLVSSFVLCDSQPVRTSSLDLTALLPPGASPAVAVLASPLLIVGSFALAWRLNRPFEETSVDGTIGTQSPREVLA